MLNLILDLEEDASSVDKSTELKPLPSLLHDGFTIDMKIRLDDFEPGQTLLECCSKVGAGWSVTTGDRETIRIELDDGRHAPEAWSTDPGLLQAGHTHHVTFIVDGGPNLILVVVDGILCDGGEDGQRGWGRFSRHLTDLGGRQSTLRIARPLRVSEAIGIYHQEDFMGNRRSQPKRKT